MDKKNLFGEETEGGKFDVGIVGWWYNENYGGTLTYFALNKVLESMGYSVLMIERPHNDPNYKPNYSSIPRRFAKKYYNISKNYAYDKLGELNKLCNMFISGSDQLFNPSLWEYSGPFYFLDFAAPDKKTVSYASSFGNRFDTAVRSRMRMFNYLKNFSALSVREDYAEDMMRKIFYLQAKKVLDPVFVCDPAEYDKLAEQSKLKFKEKYFVNFILDPDDNKRAAILHAKSALGLPFVNLIHALDFEQNIKKLNLENTRSDTDIEDFLNYYKNAEFIISDSFHGTCMAIIFEKPFISIANKQRGVGRFVSMLTELGLADRMVSDASEIQQRPELFAPIDYSAVRSRLNELKKDSYEWLKNVLAAPKETLPPVMLPGAADVMNGVQKEIDDLHANSDFIKIRLLATLLRDYGVKHIVLSPGGRDVPIVRMFEYNEGSFILHRVTDERSAAYFGMGIAAQLRQPVACVCTSGTAASNYLPAVTEAYYTGVPLIMITADRYSVYHEHGEDQTIPQSHIYDGVVKKEVTLSEGSGYYAEYQARRDISDCILESVHNGFGPTHINIAIDNISLGARAPREAWSLLPRINPHILRVGFNNGERRLSDWTAELKKSRRVLVVYGQNPPPSQQQLNSIEAFAKKYNCVIVTDFISNLDCEYSLKPYNMLQAISQQEFNEKLSPDILITVGGKRLMNDPLTFKIRNGLKNIRHWSVVPDGKIKDFYFRLTSVIEMTQDKFFEWFSSHAGDISNNGEYYKNWRSLDEKYAPAKIDRFNAHYVQSRFFPSLPPHSLLHLGVGQSFYDCRRYSMDKTVETYCNMGTNGIDGCTSTFMGQCAVVKDRLCFLLVGDLSFFYDMNGIWNKSPAKNIRILMVNNNGTGLLRGHGLKAVTSVHNTSAKGWVEAAGFAYMSAKTKEEYEQKLGYFLSKESQNAIFFEVFCE